MKHLRRQLTYANVVSSLCLFLLLGGGAAIAANGLAPNSVGTKHLRKGAVTSSKIHGVAVGTRKLAPQSVYPGKIADEAVGALQLRNEAVNGTKVDESTLGEVPSAKQAANATNAVNATHADKADNATSATSAANAANAERLDGHVSVFVKLGFGEEQAIAENGAVSFVAQCATGIEGTKDRVRVLGQTTVDGAALDGITDRHGPTNFLETTTPESDRVLVSLTQETGSSNVSGEIDQGFVMAPDGKMITVNSEGLGLGLNYAGSDCLVAGVMDLVG